MAVEFVRLAPVIHMGHIFDSSKIEPNQGARVVQGGVIEFVSLYNERQIKNTMLSMRLHE